jgi:hypothetical protein
MQRLQIIVRLDEVLEDIYCNNPRLRVFVIKNINNGELDSYNYSRHAMAEMPLKLNLSSKKKLTYICLFVIVLYSAT